MNKYSAINPCVEYDLSGEKLQPLVERAKDWALMNGLSMRYKDTYDENQVTIAPFTLFPSSFPREAFNEVRDMQVQFNELIHKVAYDYDFLKENLMCTIDNDEFTSKLFEIYETVHEEGAIQNISLGLLRADYMLDCKDNSLKQIEINTIASSFGALSTILSKYHRYALTNLKNPNECEDNLPENNIITGLCNGILYAWNIYNDPKAVILFVVEDVTYNICDQRFLEFEIQNSKPSIRIIRESLTGLISRAKLGTQRELLVDDLPVAVVYYRSGYQLEAYPTEKEWSIRLEIELSKAIKCPSIQYQLAGTKKIQQSLAQPGVLKRFFTDDTSIKKIQKLFTGLYGLEFNKKGNEAVEKALNEPNNYVLKPQREGGSHNLFGDELSSHLNSIKESKDRLAWILMDRINPPEQKNILVRPTKINDLKPTNVVSELGIYGAVIGDQHKIVYNQTIGHLLRTKESTTNEIGVAAGFGVLDSPYLFS